MNQTFYRKYAGMDIRFSVVFIADKAQKNTVGV